MSLLLRVIQECHLSLCAFTALWVTSKPSDIKVRITPQCTIIVTKHGSLNEHYRIWVKHKKRYEFKNGWGVRCFLCASDVSSSRLCNSQQSWASDNLYNQKNTISKEIIRYFEHVVSNMTCRCIRPTPNMKKKNYALDFFSVMYREFYLGVYKKKSKTQKLIGTFSKTSGRLNKII